MRRVGALASLVLALAASSPQSALASSVAPVASRASASAEQKDAGLAALEKQLKDPSDKQRREAVQGLAKLASTEAWGLVIDALKDPAPMVADEAQLQLGSLADAKTIDALTGKRGLGAGDAWVRLRVAEALGRAAGKVGVTDLAAHLSDKSADVRRALAWSIERRAHGPSAKEDIGDAVVALAVVGHVLLQQEKDPSVLAAVVLAAGALDDDAEKPLVEPLLTAKAADVRCAVLKDAVDWSPAKRFDAAKKMLADPAFAVRVQAAETLATCHSKAACALLIDRLEKETSLRLRWRIVAELQRLSGSDLELTPAYWKKWVDGLDDSWEPKTAEPSAKKKDEKLPEGTTVFLGLPVLSERVAILVDFSGSLWQKRADGKTRKQSVDEELTKLLKQLSPSTKFNLVPYTNEPNPWQKALVPATPENVIKALAFFTNCKDNGKGNVWDAIELAAKDPEVDTLVVLTDGAPTGGHRWNLELMEPLLAEHLRFKKIALDAILVDAGRFLQERWERITAATGGRMQSVEMK